MKPLNPPRNPLTHGNPETKAQGTRKREEDFVKRLPVVGREKRTSSETTPTAGNGTQAQRGSLRASKDKADSKGASRNQEERWSEDIATLRKAAEELALKRGEPAKALEALVRNTRPQSDSSAFHQIATSMDDPAAEVRNAAVRALYDLDPDRAASLFNVALREGSMESRRRIGAALADSGLIDEAINNLMAENHENCYGAFSLLFLVANAGEVQPLIRVIKNHPSIDLRLAVIRLLAASDEPEVLPAFRRLEGSSSLATEVRAAVAEAINKLSNEATKNSAA